MLLRLVLPLVLLAVACGARAAPFRDDMAQRTLACTSCHGKEGRAGPDGYYPRLAGKPAGYLYNQLLHFRDGRRNYALMARLLDPLSDEYLAIIAQHFAALDVPYAQPAATRGSPLELERGKVLALQGDAQRRLPACSQCHGAALTGALPNIPGLLGLPRDYLNAQMGAWRTGQRRAHAPDCMADLAQRMTHEDVAAVTAWLAAQPVARRGKPEAAPRTPLPSACGSAALPAGRPQ